jgi:hypothetical protein
MKKSKTTKEMLFPEKKSMDKKWGYISAAFACVQQQQKNKVFVWKLPL